MFSLYLPLLISSTAAPGAGRVQAAGQTGLHKGLCTCAGWGGGLETLMGLLEFRARPLEAGYRHNAAWLRVAVKSWGCEARSLMRAWRHACGASLVPGLGSGSGLGAEVQLLSCVLSRLTTYIQSGHPLSLD